MSDDIVGRLNVEIEAESWGLLVDARDEIERLHRRDDVLQVVMSRLSKDIATLTADLAAEQAEVERLRAAGDALAHLMPHAHFKVPCRSPQGVPLDEWCSECAALAVWQEARRG